MVGVAVAVVVAVGVVVVVGVAVAVAVVVGVAVGVVVVVGVAVAVAVGVVVAVAVGVGVVVVVGVAVAVAVVVGVAVGVVVVVGVAVVSYRDYHLRSYRIFDAMAELRVARRIGRRLTDDEAQRLQQGSDHLDLRMRMLRRLNGRLSAHLGYLSVEWEKEAAP